MSTLLNDDELAAAVRGIAVSDPLPDVDPTKLTARGRRGLRRRRVASITAAGTLTAAAAVTAATLPPLLGGDDAAPLGQPTTSPAKSPAPHKSSAVSAADAALLKRCGGLVGTDLTGWQLVAKSTEPGYLTVLQALDPVGATVAFCNLAGPKLPFAIPAAWNGTAPAQGRPLPSNMPSRPVPTERHLFEQGTETCGQGKPECAGFLFYETGRLPRNAARLHAVAEDGRTADFVVRDGWYAVAWADRGQRDGMGPVQWTIYDAHGKVLDRKK